MSARPVKLGAGMDVRSPVHGRHLGRFLAEADDRVSQGGGEGVGSNVDSILASCQAPVVEALCDLGGRGVVNLPQPCDDVLVSGDLQSVRQRDALVGDDGASPAGVACRNIGRGQGQGDAGALSGRW
jgi:hypothetical protein